MKHYTSQFDMDAAQREREHLVRQMRQIVDKCGAENRDLTVDETQRFNSLKAQIDALAEEIHMNTSRGRVSQPSQPGAGAPYGAGTGMADPFARQPGRLVAFAGQGGPERAYRSGMWLKAQLLGDEHATRWCREHGLMVAAASESINTQGGFLVPDELAGSIIRLVNEHGVFRRECRVWPMSSDTLSVPRREGGLTAHFVGENTEGTESDVVWGNVSFVARKLMCLTRMSSEISDDAIVSAADVLAEEVGLAFAEKEDQCGFNGTGAASFGGIVGVTQKIIDGNHTAGAIDTVTANADTFAELALADLSNLMAKLPQYARANAKFYCSEVAWSLLFERILAAAGGNAIANFADPVERRYLGYPVVVTPVLPTSTGSLDNQAMILFGDLRKAAGMGDRQQMRLMLSEHRYFELDQIGIRGTERFDINVHDLGNNTTAGPMVALIGAA